jgi:hypothetical protein
MCWLMWLKIKKVGSVDYSVVKSGVRKAMLVLLSSNNEENLDSYLNTKFM